jgi:cephalosporin hydroxylase
MRLRAVFRRNIAKRVYRNPLIARFVGRQYHRTFYYSRDTTWKNTSWFGVPLLKCPLDMWVYQEILFELKPKVIIETGTFRGGSACYMGALCDLMGEGRIMTIDINELPPTSPRHDRVTYVTASSVAESTIEKVREFIGGDAPVLVVLDSDHTRDHVLQELRLFAGVVTPGSYMIVEDSNINGHPINPGSGPGPMEAIRAFLEENDRFAIDDSREKYFMTFNPRGYLKCLR